MLGARGIVTAITLLTDTVLEAAIVLRVRCEFNDYMRSRHKNFQSSELTVVAARARRHARRGRDPRHSPLAPARSKSHSLPALILSRSQRPDVGVCTHGHWGAAPRHEWSLGAGRPTWVATPAGRPRVPWAGRLSVGYRRSSPPPEETERAGGAEIGLGRLHCTSIKRAAKVEGIFLRMRFPPSGRPLEAGP